VTSPEFSLYQFRGLLPLDGITDPEIIAHAVRDYLDQFLFQKLTGTIPEGLLFQADIRK
jgi:hypothetical protein